MRIANINSHPIHIYKFHLHLHSSSFFFCKLIFYLSLLNEMNQNWKKNGNQFITPVNYIHSIIVWTGNVLKFPIISVNQIIRLLTHTLYIVIVYTLVLYTIHTHTRTANSEYILMLWSCKNQKTVDHSKRLDGFQAIPCKWTHVCIAQSHTQQSNWM